MDVIDIVLLVIIGLAAVTGFVKGIVSQLGAIAAIVAAIIVCRLFGSDVADIIVKPGADHETTYRVLCYAGLFVATYLVVWLVTRLFKAAVSALKMGPLDRLGGALFRVAEWLILLSVLLNVYLAIRPADRDVLTAPDKPWRGFVVGIAPTLQGYIAD